MAFALAGARESILRKDPYDVPLLQLACNLIHGLLQQFGILFPEFSDIA